MLLTLRCPKQRLHFMPSLTVCDKVNSVLAVWELASKALILPSTSNAELPLPSFWIQSHWPPILTVLCSLHGCSTCQGSLLITTCWHLISHLTCRTLVHTSWHRWQSFASSIKRLSPMPPVKFWNRCSIHQATMSWPMLGWSSQWRCSSPQNSYQFLHWHQLKAYVHWSHQMCPYQAQGHRNTGTPEAHWRSWIACPQFPANLQQYIATYWQSYEELLSKLLSSRSPFWLSIQRPEFCLHGWTESSGWSPCPTVTSGSSIQPWAPEVCYAPSHRWIFSSFRSVQPFCSDTWEWQPSSGCYASHARTPKRSVRCTA